MPLPLREASFDLLLALFAGGIAASCYKYLKVGGYLLTNDHQGDAMDAVQSADLQLRAKVVYQKHAYIISEAVNEGEMTKRKSNNKYLRQTDQGISYVERETYYLFQRRS